MTYSTQQISRPLMLTAALTALGGTASAVPLAQSVALQDLGAPAGTNSLVQDVSHDGSVAVGYVHMGSSLLEAFVWSESQGFLSLDSAGVDRTNARIISGDGRVAAGITVVTSPTSSIEAAIWDTATGARTDLGFLPGATSGSTTSHVSEDGSTVFGGSRASSSPWQAFHWTAATGMQPLGSLGALETVVSGISRDGSVAVGHGTTAPEVRVATTWTLAGGLQPIPGLSATAVSSKAEAVSSDGRFVLGEVYDPTAASGFFYHDRNLGTTLISSSVGFGPLTFARGMSGDGQTLLLQDNVAGANPYVFLWRPATGAIVPVAAASGQISWRDISEEGEVVTGLRYSSGVPIPVRWTASAGVEDLPTWGGPYQDTLEVSSEGNVFFGYSIAPSLLSRATIWRDSGELGMSYCGPAVPNSTGSPGQIRISGTNYSQAPGLAELHGSGLPVGATAIFLASNTAGFVSPVVGSEGNLCLGGAIGRFVGPGQVQMVNAGGEIALPLDSTQLPSPTGNVSATFGESWYFQAWHRDVSSTGAATSNFTNGATVRFY